MAFTPELHIITVLREKRYKKALSGGQSKRTLEPQCKHCKESTYRCRFPHPVDFHLFSIPTLAIYTARLQPQVNKNVFLPYPRLECQVDYYGVRDKR